MEKTAMQELIETLKKKNIGMAVYLNANTDIINEMLNKEKQQIETAFKDGVTNEIHPTIWYADSETYYNQKYINNE